MDKTPTKWMIEPLRRYAQFVGRAPRAEFWWFTLFVDVVLIAALVIDRQLGWGNIGIRTVVSLAVLCPHIAVGVRRLHDLDRSGWWWVGAMIGIVSFSVLARSTRPAAAAGELSDGALAVLWLGALAVLSYMIVMLIWYCQRGTAGDNRFGPDPIGRPFDHQL